MNSFKGKLILSIFLPLTLFTDATNTLFGLIWEVNAKFDESEELISKNNFCRTNTDKKYILSEVQATLTDVEFAKICHN